MSENAHLDDDELMHLALRAIDQQEAEQALRYLKQIPEETASYSKAVYLLGALHAEIGMHERAIGEMQQAVVLDPGLHTAHFQLGLLHLISGQVDDAAAAWQPLDELGEDSYLFLFKRGMLSLAQDHYNECIDDLNRGMELNIENEALNNDMRNVIAQAQQSLQSNVQTAIGSDSRGYNVLLSAYQRNDIESGN